MSGGATHYRSEIFCRQLLFFAVGVLLVLPVASDMHSSFSRMIRNGAAKTPLVMMKVPKGKGPLGLFCMDLVGIGRRRLLAKGYV